MNKKNNVGTLITIILLLIVFLPCAIYGTYMNIKKGGVVGNPNKEFYYNGKLYFYNGEELLGTYKCNTNNCGYAKNNILNNQEFEDFNKLDPEIKLIDNHYAFIEDGDKVVLYDILKGLNIIDYKSVKNYAIGIADNYYLVENTNGLWGIIKVGNNVKMVVPFNYDYLGLLYKINNNKNIISDKIIAKKADDWYLVTNDNNIILKTKELIIDYSNDYVITKDDGFVYAYDYRGNKLLENNNFNDIKVLDKLIIGKTNTNFYVIYDGTKNAVLKNYFINNNEEYNFKVENNNLIVEKNNSVFETIALN